MTLTAVEPVLSERALTAAAARYPGRSAAVWLLARTNWLQDVMFLDCVRPSAEGPVVKWAQFAHRAAESQFPHYDVAVALSAGLLADAPLPPVNPAGEMTNAGVLHRDRYVCVYCGDDADTVDHVIPQAAGGETSWENCVACCEPCNVEKGSRTLESLGWSLRAHPSVWSQDRIDTALGTKGRYLVLRATAVRDVMRAELADTISAGLTAALGALGIPAARDGRDSRDRALMLELATLLNAEARNARGCPRCSRPSVCICPGKGW